MKRELHNVICDIHKLQGILDVLNAAYLMAIPIRDREMRKELDKIDTIRLAVRTGIEEKMVTERRMWEEDKQNHWEEEQR